MKRMHGTLAGKRISLRLDDWKELRERFNPAASTMWAAPSIRAIYRSCPLCRRYRKNNCRRCTFNKFAHKKNPGCVVVLKTLVGGYTTCIYAGINVRWMESDDAAARQELAMLRSRLDSMELRDNKRGKEVKHAAEKE